MTEIKLPGLSVEETRQVLPPHGRLIFLGYRGSIAHGMYVPQSDKDGIDDKDIMGVFVAPPEHYLGLGQVKETVERTLGPWDAVHYEVGKLFRLLLKSNPNVLSLLFLHDSAVIYEDEMGAALRSERRKCFLSKQAYKAFAGYANGQLHRMTHHVKEGYMGEKRKRLVARYGYDTKNAAHLVRLLRMGIEFLTEGVLHVLRHDSHELLAIKRGEWTLAQVKAESDRLFALAHEAYVRSDLPAGPDREVAGVWLQALLMQALGLGGQSPAADRSV